MSKAVRWLDLVKQLVSVKCLTRQTVEQRRVAVDQSPMSPAMIAELWPEQAH